MNLKNFVIVTVLAIVMFTLGLNFVNDIVSTTNTSLGEPAGVNFTGLTSDTESLMAKINQTASSGVVSLGSVVNIVTIPLDVVSIAVKTTYKSFAMLMALTSQITGVPTIIITAVATIFAIWVAWEVIRLIWGRS